jgi:hypothetical protein
MVTSGEGAMSLDDEDDGARSARVIAMLADRFPQSFFVAEQERRPLKTGIFRDIRAALGDGIDEFQLSAALAMYCRAVGYLRRCKEGTPRIDLSGEPPERSAQRKRGSPGVDGVGSKTARRDGADLSDACRRGRRDGRCKRRTPRPALRGGPEALPRR